MVHRHAHGQSIHRFKKIEEDEAEEVEEGTEDLICDHYLVCQEKFDRVSKF